MTFAGKEQTYISNLISKDFSKYIFYNDSFRWGVNNTKRRRDNTTMPSEKTNKMVNYSVPEIA